MAATRDTIRRLGVLLEARGYTHETPRLGAELLAVKRGRGLGPFFPYVDYLFVHDLDGMADAGALERRHEEACAYAESQFALPRSLRYRIPNTVTVGVSEAEFAPDVVRSVTTPRPRSLAGGARDSTYLIDVASGRLVSAGLDATPTPHGGRTTTSVNPTNRVYRMMVQIAAALGLEAGGAL